MPPRPPGRCLVIIRERVAKSSFYQRGRSLMSLQRSVCLPSLRRLVFGICCDGHFTSAAAQFENQNYSFTGAAAHSCFVDSLLYQRGR